MNKKTGRPQYSAEQRLMAIAPMLVHNRKRESAASPSRRRDRLGRFTGAAYGIAKQIAAEHRISINTVWNWYCLHQRFGFRALARKKRLDAGRSTFLHHHPKLRPAIDARLSNGLSPFGAWKSLRRACGSDAPCYDVVLNYARRRYRPDGGIFGPCRIGGDTR